MIIIELGCPHWCLLIISCSFMKQSEKQEGIPPQMFKTTMAASYSKFSSMKEQVNCLILLALHYFYYMRHFCTTWQYCKLKIIIILALTASILILLIPETFFSFRMLMSSFYIFLFKLTIFILTVGGAGDLCLILRAVSRLILIFVPALEFLFSVAVFLFP